MCINRIKALWTSGNEAYWYRVNCLLRKIGEKPRFEQENQGARIARNLKQVQSTELSYWFLLGFSFSLSFALRKLK